MIFILDLTFWTVIVKYEYSRSLECEEMTLIRNIRSKALLTSEISIHHTCYCKFFSLHNHGQEIYLALINLISNAMRHSYHYGIWCVLYL